MDEEDLAEAAEAQQLQTAGSFAGLGSTEGDAIRHGNLMGLFKTEGETMGVKLLKKMGWKEGQGVGPRIRRAARLGGSKDDETTHLFAPDNTQMITFSKKTDHKGLGFEGESRLDTGLSVQTNAKSLSDEGEEVSVFGTAPKAGGKKKKSTARGGIGIGILNDTGSDDEDPYEIGPRISYNRTIDGDKKKKKKPLAASNPSAAVRPVFVSKKAAMAKAAIGFRKCHDGRLPLDGFILSTNSDALSSIINSDGKYPAPKIPDGWSSSKQPVTGSETTEYLSTADAAKASNLDPKARAKILGETALPGKSVFDFLSSSARDRIAAASGKDNLPVARGEVPAEYVMTPLERANKLLSEIPKIGQDVALAALGRGATGWMPYAEDEGKRLRYRIYLENQAGHSPDLLQRPLTTSKDDWLKELQEFANCAQIFKPMTGMMATRFTTSSSAPKVASDKTESSSANELLSQPSAKPEDPAEAAAKVGMFGPMTRYSNDFYPTRLLCKRFNVKPPAHVQLDPERKGDDAAGGGFQAQGQSKNLELISKSAIDDMMKEHWDRPRGTDEDKYGDSIKGEDFKPPEPVVVDVERNEALEGKKVGEDVFKAIFGDSDEDE
jgi:G patch domain-containing protein 1